MNIFKVLIKKIIIILAILLVLTFFIEDKVGYIQGLVGGVLYSIFNFKLLAYTTKKVVFMTKTKAVAFTFGSYFIRYLLTGLVLVSVILYSSTMFLGTVLGMLILKIAIYLSSKKILTEDF